MGAARVRHGGCDGRDPHVEPRPVALRARKHSARGLSLEQLLQDLGRRPRQADARARIGHGRGARGRPLARARGEDRQRAHCRSCRARPRPRQFHAARRQTSAARFAVGGAVRTKSLHPIRIRACRAIAATSPAPSRGFTVRTSSPTRTRSARARSRNGSTPCASRRPTFGVPTPPPWRSSWIAGNPTWPLSARRGGHDRQGRGGPGGAARLADSTTRFSRPRGKPRRSR